MTPEEIAALRRLGEDVIPWNLCVPITSALVYGIVTPGFLYVIIAFWSEGFQSRAKQIIFVTTISCFLFAAAIVVVESLFLSTFLNAPASLGQYIDIAGAIEAANSRAFRIDYISRSIYGVVLNINDAIVLWRAWVLYSSKLYVMALPSLCWTSSVFTFWVFQAFVRTWADWDGGSRASHYGWNIASNFLSLSTNVATVALFSYQLRRLRVLWRDANIRPNQPTSAVQKRLILLLDSGVIFCVFHLLGIIITTLIDEGLITNYKSYIVLRSIIQILFSVIAAYPMVVFVAIRTQKLAMNLPSLLSQNVVLLSDDRAQTHGHNLAATTVTNEAHVLESFRKLSCD